jgi:hypothetical protein
LVPAAYTFRFTLLPWTCRQQVPSKWPIHIYHTTHSHSPHPWIHATVRTSNESYNLV